VPDVVAPGHGHDGRGHRRDEFALGAGVAIAGWRRVNESRVRCAYCAS